MFGEVINNIRRILKNNEGYRIDHIFRKANQCVDCLIKIGTRTQFPLNI